MELRIGRSASQYVFLCFYEFSGVDTAGGMYQFQQKGKKRIREAVTKHIFNLLVLGC